MVEGDHKRLLRPVNRRNKNLFLDGAFPHNAYDYWSLREQRKKLSNTTKNFFFTSEGKTIKDKLPIPFTMRGEDLTSPLIIRREVILLCPENKLQAATSHAESVKVKQGTAKKRRS